MLARFKIAAALGASAIAATGLVGAAPASAAQITYLSDTVTGTPHYNGFFAFNQFDAALGTLTNVSFTVFALLEGTSGYENLSTSSITYTTLQQFARAEVRTDDGAAVAFPYWQSAQKISTVFDGFLDFNGTSGFLGSGSGYDVGTFSTQNVAPYTGKGIFYATYAVTGPGDGTTTSGQGVYYDRAKVSLQARLTYDYDAASNPPASAVPEPATWAMLIAGFGLTGAAMRRRPRAAPALA